VDTYSQFPWTDAQWTQIQETVRDEAKKQRLAASFLPLYGPVPHDAQTVPLQALTLRPDPIGAGDFLEIDDYRTRRLTTLSVRVSLGTAQMAQSDLSSALVAFRHAANLIARAEDRLVLFMSTGQNALLPAGLNPAITTGGDFFEGLLTTAVNDRRTVSLAAPPAGPPGQQLVQAVGTAIGMLEANGHLPPFALVLNTQLFNVAHTPDPLPGLVLPADRIKPWLDGPLLRSSLLNWANLPQGVVVSLADDLVDLVVASEICVRFLQVTTDASPKYVFRVSERFTLRIKQRTAVVAIIA
jgi:uncharacterized linocin/CFP29 family protein